MLRFDPFNELDRLARRGGQERGGSVLAFDAVRDDDEVTIYFDVPGVTLDDIDLSVEKNELTVRVTRRWDDEGKTVLATERQQGDFARRLMLGDALDVERATADLDQGVLIVKVPVAEKAQKRSIAVSSRSERDEQASGD